MLGCCSRDKKSEPINEYLHDTDKQYYQQALQSEKKVLHHTQLKPDEEIKSHNIFLDEFKTLWIHTIECGYNNNKNNNNKNILDKNSNFLK